MAGESRKKSIEFALDDLDEAILRLLEADGRLPKSTIAEALGVSRGLVAERLSQLLDSGAVVVLAVPHPLLLGVHWMGYALVEVEGPLGSVAGLVAADPAVPFCSIVTGASPLRAEIRASSAEAAVEVIARIRALPGVCGVEVVQYLKVVRDVVAPVGPISTRVDPVDRRILAELQADGRMSLSALAAKVRRSPTATRERLARLLAGSAVRIGAVLRHGAPFGRRAMGVGLQLHGGDEEVIARLLDMPDLLFAARAMGRFDVVATMRAGSAAELHEVVETVRGWPGVRTAYTWVHLDIVKEQYYNSGGLLRQP